MSIAIARFVVILFTGSVLLGTIATLAVPLTQRSSPSNTLLSTPVTVESLSPAHRMYHLTDTLLSILQQLALSCPHADAEWTTIFPTPSNLTFHPFPPHSASILTITVTEHATHRNAARRAHRPVPPRPAIVATFGEHGRERITSELALRILQTLCPSSLTTPVQAPQTLHEVLHDLLHSIEFVLIPIANPSGRRLVESGRDCWRLNSHGVDLNRNYRHHWGQQDSTTVRDEEHSGSKPLSEFETRAIDAIVRRHLTATYLSVHSGDRAIIPPWDWRGDAAGIPPVVDVVARAVANAHCQGCIVARAFEAFGYRAYGTGVDHMMAERRVPIALTVEIYGGDERYCRDMFNPTSEHVFDSVMSNWSHLLHTVAESVLAYNSTARLPLPEASDSYKYRSIDSIQLTSHWMEEGYRVEWHSAHLNAPPYSSTKTIFTASKHPANTRTFLRDHDSRTAVVFALLTLPSIWLFSRRNHRPQYRGLLSHPIPRKRTAMHHADCTRSPSCP